MRRVFVTLSLLSLLVLLSGCKSAGADEFIYWGKMWAMVHDLTDADGSPNLGAVTRFTAGEAFGLGTTGDDEGDAAIDAGRLVDKIRRAEDESKLGEKNLFAGDWIEPDVLPHFNQAVSLRPDDWYYRNLRGIAYLEEAVPEKVKGPDVKAAQADFDRAIALAKASRQPGEYLRMLKQREQAMARRVGVLNSVNGGVSVQLYQEQSRTYGELYQITQDRSYLLLKQQADTNIQEGKGWKMSPDGRLLPANAQ